MDADDILEPLSAVIVIVATKQGIKFDVIQVQDICSFHQKHFGDFTINEIPLAFELLAAGKFELPERAGHYGLLSMEYWGQVMNKYKIYRTNEIRKANLIAESEIKRTTINKEKRLNHEAMKGGVLTSWGHFKEFKVMPYRMDNDLVTEHYYNWLRDNDLMNPPTSDAILSIKLEAKAAYKESLKKDDMTLTEHRLMKQGINNIDNGSAELKVKSLCKKIGVRVFFENLMFENKDLKEMIEGIG